MQGTFEVVVDGETFAVSNSSLGRYHFEWVAGPRRPHGGYGYSSHSNVGEAMTLDEMREEIRDWMTNVIDPDTGQIWDD